MAIRLYNIKNHALNAGKLSEILDFSSNDFCGMITNLETPFEYSSGLWSWLIDQGEPIKFISGGIYLEYDSPGGEFGITGNDYMWGLDIVLTETGANISTDNFSSASLIQVKCGQNSGEIGLQAVETYFPVIGPYGNPHDKGYYEYTGSGWVVTSDTTVQGDKIYYYMVEKQAFEMRNVLFPNMTSYKSFSYQGQTLWITDNRMFIPLCGLDHSGNFCSLIFNRDSYNHESFLTARTYYALLEELGDKFVWHSGGASKGDVGNLNITDNTISSTTGYKVAIEYPYLTNVSVPVGDNISNLLTIDPDSSSATYGKVFRTSPTYKMPIIHGGTGADNRQTAKSNLGIYYGTALPANANISTPIEGDIYFRLI